MQPCGAPGLAASTEMSGAAISQGPQAIDPAKGRPARPKSKIRNSSSRRKKSPPWVSCRLGCARRHHIALGYHLAPEGRLAWARAQLLVLTLLLRPIDWRVNVLWRKVTRFQSTRAGPGGWLLKQRNAWHAVANAIRAATGSIVADPGASWCTWCKASLLIDISIQSDLQTAVDAP